MHVKVQKYQRINLQFNHMILTYEILCKGSEGLFIFMFFSLYF